MKNAWHSVRHTIRDQSTEAAMIVKSCSEFRSHLIVLYYFFLHFFERERKGERETKREKEENIDQFLHLFMHSLVASYMCPDQTLKPQPWHIGRTLLPTELPGQGNASFIFLLNS